MSATSELPEFVSMTVAITCKACGVTMTYAVGAEKRIVAAAMEASFEMAVHTATEHPEVAAQVEAAFDARHGA